MPIAPSLPAAPAPGLPAPGSIASRLPAIVRLAFALGAAIALAGCDPDEGGVSLSAPIDGWGTADTDSVSPSDTGAGGDTWGGDAGGQPDATPDPQDALDDSGAAPDADGEPDAGPAGIPCTGEGTSCDDQNPCTTNDLCQGGVCRGAPLYDDQLHCTLTCVPGPGGIPVQISGPDRILEGWCVVGGVCHAAGTAAPGNPCRVCSPEANPEAFSHADDDLPCSDGNACTTNDRCQAGACLGDPVFPSEDPCVVTCVVDRMTGAPKQTSIKLPDGVACVPDDGDPCEHDHVCLAGVCVGQPIDCKVELDSPCYEATCESGTCVLGEPLEPGAACDDRDPCTTNDACDAEQVCVGTFTPGEPCDDADACTVNDVCVEGVCMGSPAPDGTTCDDGDPCTEPDTCLQGVCQGPPKVCPDPGPCRTSECELGQCKVVAEPDGTLCEDSDPCTHDGACSNAQCVSVPLECPEPTNPCKDAVCVGEGCQEVDRMSGTPCDDGDPCTHSDQCISGQCVGIAIACPGGETCVGGACEPVDE